MPLDPVPVSFWWPSVQFCRWLRRDDVVGLYADPTRIFCGELALIDVEWIRLWLEAGCGRDAA